MPISNVALTNTFDEWRVATNQLIVVTNDLLGDGLTTYRSVTANVITANSLFFGTLNVVPTLSAAYDKANSANVVAVSAFGKANAANVIASAAFDKANAANVIASAAFDKANTAGSLAFDKANAANVLACTAFDKANSAVRTGWTKVWANGTTITASSNADTLSFITTGNISLVGVSANANAIMDLTDTGVTASTYGNNTIIPVFVVDSKGRLTSVTNTTIASVTSGANVGSGGANVFKQISSTEMQFRTVKVATSVTNTGSTNDYVQDVTLSIAQGTNDLTITLNVTKRDGYTPPPGPP